MARGNRVAEVKNEDAAIVELAVVEAARFVDLDSELAAERLTSDAVAEV